MHIDVRGALGALPPRTAWPYDDGLLGQLTHYRSPGNVKRYASAGRGADVLVLVFVVKEPRPRCDPSRFGPRRRPWVWLPVELPESAFDRIDGSDVLALGEGFVAPTGEELVEVVAPSVDGSRVIVVPAIGKAPGDGAGLRHSVGVHDSLKSGLDRRLVANPHLVENIEDLCAQQR